MTKWQISAATAAGELTDADFHELETLAHDGDSVPHRAMQRLVREVLRLKHELNDPAFMYASGRASRDSILCRNATIDRLRTELTEAKKLAVYPAGLAMNAALDGAAE